MVYYLSANIFLHRAIQSYESDSDSQKAANANKMMQLPKSFLYNEAFTMYTHTDLDPENLLNVNSGFFRRDNISYHRVIEYTCVILQPWGKS